MFRQMIRTFFFIILLIQNTVIFAEYNRLLLSNGQKIFASGMNLAWIHFAEDIVDLDEVEFNRAFDEISSAGGNTVRWWLHVNGSLSPQFDDGKVYGLYQNEISNLLKILDLAQKHDLVLIPVLWSFDMLKPNRGVDVTRNKRLIEEDDYLQAYIDNALIPLVRGVKGHPALLSWEICNEPEGMSDIWGWTKVKTSKASIQKFHNRIAGAIHREAPEAIVTTGCWNIQVMCDVHGFTNWYSDEALVSAGGDSLGYLDFYQVHYYPRWYGEAHSPFHHPASHWQLDKPILIGEFQACGIHTTGPTIKLETELTTEKAYLYAIQNGYAGALSWTWTGHDGHGDVRDAEPGMQRLKQDYPKSIIIKK